MSLASRLLGLAFAAADALIEVDDQGIVRFALGAGVTPQKPVANWVGLRFVEQLRAESASRIQTELSQLGAGSRASNIEVMIECGPDLFRAANLSLFRLPELDPSVSMAISYLGQPIAAKIIEQDSAPADGPQLIAHLRRKLNDVDPRTLQRLSLAFVDVPEMSDLDGATKQDIQNSIVHSLRNASLDGNSAAQLSPDRFALVRNEDDAWDVDQEIRKIGESRGSTLTPRMGQSSLGSDGVAALRAMRFAIEACLREEALDSPELHFANTLSRTLRDADRFRTMVRDRDFALFYQPIVELKTRTIKHYEALSRFPKTSGPAAAIRMAEELSLIESFDRTVAEMAISRLKSPGNGNLKLAINVSGASLANDDYITAILAMSATSPEVRSRLIIEVTETAALADLVSANRRLSTLRETGICVCIDDFGAGSASFDYLNGLNVDIVKIDGSLVHNIENETRSRTLVTHLVDLCRSLELQTVAEMVETENQSRILQELGVTHAQGWLFGKAEPEPRPILQMSSPVIARRRGTTESWG